ncbi:MAG: DNA alkylation repair protein [Patescibacteria group bacterium]
MINGIDFKKTNLRMVKILATEKEIIKKLKSLARPKNVAGMARFGIRPKAKVLGVPMPELRALAKKIGRSHNLAGQLWQSGIHEAKILASLVEELEKVNSAQMDKWVRGFDSWDVCDQVCLNLFFNHPLAFKKCVQWSNGQKEFVRRAGFALMACLAFKNKQAEDNDFVKLFPLIKKYATDERNYVRKAVNWALRQIGKRNLKLNKRTIKVAEEIKRIKNKTAKWIAADALRELKGRAF